LQCVAVCCSVSQCVAVCCSMPLSLLTDHRDRVRHDGSPPKCTDARWNEKFQKFLQKSDLEFFSMVNLNLSCLLRISDSCSMSADFASMTHSYVLVTWLTHMRWWHDSLICVGEMTHLYLCGTCCVCICTKWLIHFHKKNKNHKLCDKTHSYTFVTWFIYMCVWHDCICMCVWHDSFIRVCVTWHMQFAQRRIHVPIHMCDMTH